MDTAVFHLISYKNWCNVQFANSYLLSLYNCVYCWVKKHTGSFFVQFLIFLEVNNYLLFSIACFDLNLSLPSPFNSVKCLPVQFSKNHYLFCIFFPRGIPSRACCCPARIGLGFSYLFGSPAFWTLCVLELHAHFGNTFPPVPSWETTHRKWVFSDLECQKWL